MKRFVIILFSLLAAVSCVKEEHASDRRNAEHYKSVLVVMQFGYNDLVSYFQKNVKQMLYGNESSFSQRNSENAPLPKYWEDKAVLLFTHYPNKYGDYNTETVPALCRVYEDITGRIAMDTVLTFPAGTVGADKDVIRKVMNYTRDNFSSDYCSVVLSSHGTGWLDKSVANPPKTPLSRKHWQSAPDFWSSYNTDPDAEMIKSFGAHYNGSRTKITEINIDELAGAFPFKLDNLILDACLMGGIETAWELKDACNYLAFSPCPILADGFYYPTMLKNFIGGDEPDIEAACRDYANYYKDRCYTVTLVDCTKLEPLATAAKAIIDAHRAGINALEPIVNWEMNIQYYYDWSAPETFCDLGDILTKCGSTPEEITTLQTALDNCIIYKDNSNYFSPPYVKIERYSGFSMYLPKSRWTKLNAYYKTLGWNIATGLLE